MKVQNKTKTLKEEVQQKISNAQKPEITIKDIELSERIPRNQISLITMAQYKLDTDKSLYEKLDNLEQAFYDADFDKQKYIGKELIQSGKVIYESRTHKTEIIFEGSFEPIGNYNYNAQTEKIKDALEEKLITQYLQTQSPTIFISIKELAEEINVRASDLRKRILYIMESLQSLRISYTNKHKTKGIFTDFASIRIISSSEYHKQTDILEVNFDNKYAFNLAIHKFFQLPKKYRKINDNTYQYAYPLTKYIYELCRHDTNRIQFKTLYNQIKKIPRIEDIRKTHQSPTQKIYEPLIKHFIELNKQNDFEIKFENEDFMLSDARQNIDFDKMLETYIVITWKNKPDYTKIDKSKQKGLEKIQNDRYKNYAKAIDKKALS